MALPPELPEKIWQLMILQPSWAPEPPATPDDPAAANPREGIGGPERTVTIKIRTKNNQDWVSYAATRGGGDTAYYHYNNAKVNDINVEVGQTIHKGDVLLTFDTEDLGDNLAKVKIQARSERAASNESFEAANKAAGKANKADSKAKKINKQVKSLKDDVEDKAAGINAILKKLQIAQKWYKEKWGLDLFKIRNEVRLRQDKVNDFVKDNVTIYDLK